MLKRWAGVMTSHAAAGQLQQRPTAREGGLFKREWFSNPVKRVPDKQLDLVRAWDLASASDVSIDPDYTVGLLMGRDRDTHMLFIIDVIRGRFSPGERQRKIISTATLDGTACRIRIPQDPAVPASSMRITWPVCCRAIGSRANANRAAKRIAPIHLWRNASMASSSWLRRHGTGTLSTNYVRSRIGHMTIRSMRRRLRFGHWFAGPFLVRVTTVAAIEHHRRKRAK